jgi:hypothetical protein
MGKRVRPLIQKIDRLAWFKSRKSFPNFTALRKFEWAGYRWAFVWPKPLYELVKEFPIFSDGTATWYEEHPFLTIRPRIVESASPRLLQYPPPLDLLTGVDCCPRLV